MPRRRRPGPHGSGPVPGPAPAFRKRRNGRSLSESLGVVGAPFDPEQGAGAGALEVFELTDLGWRRADRLTALDADVLDRLGHSVAISSAGCVAAGAPMDDEAADNAGAVYVFERGAGGWSQQKLLAPDTGTSAGDTLGSSVAIDGTDLWSGAPGTAADAGAVIVFERGGDWTFAQTLSPSDATACQEFGHALAIDGERAIVGAPGKGSGAVYVYERSAGTWSEVAKLTPFDGADGDRFGAACALDGARIAVASPTRGAVYLYEEARQDPTGWRLVQRVAPANGQNIGFARALALLGTRLIVGAPEDAPSGGASLAKTGSLHVFEVDSASVTPVGVLFAAGGQADEELGRSVALSTRSVWGGAPAGSASEASGSLIDFALQGSDCNANGRPDVCDLFDGTSPDLDSDGRPDECGGAVGTRFCFGHGPRAACPCDNTSPPLHDEGCESSVGVGVRLDATGVTSLAADSLQLTATGLPEGRLTVFFQGTERQPGGGVPFGDGLLCVAGAIQRLGSSISLASTAVLPPEGTGPVSRRGSVLSPGVRTYQAWVRDPADFCTPDAFNLSSAVEVFWGP